MRFVNSLFLSLLFVFPLHSQEREKQTDADATFRQYYEQVITFTNTKPVRAFDESFYISTDAQKETGTPGNITY